MSVTRHGFLMKSVNLWPMVLVLGLHWAVVTMAAQAAEFRVPLMPERPAIDGKIEPAEWRCAAGFDGFFSGDTLERRRVRAWIGADEQTIYVAIQSQLPDTRAAVGRRHPR